jgi:hypothetical protein
MQDAESDFGTKTVPCVRKTEIDFEWKTELDSSKEEVQKEGQRGAVDARPRRA